MPIYVKADKVKSDHTYTQFPITINDNTDSAVPEWCLFGAGSQTGTPTPDNLIQPQFVGVRTGNLFDYKTVYASFIDANGDVVGQLNTLTAWNYFTPEQVGKQLTISFYVGSINASYVRVQGQIDGEYITGNAINSGQTGYTQITVTPTATTDRWRITYGSGTPSVVLNQFVVADSETREDYEPYGYKIQISCAGQTVPVYLGQTQTVRRIKKRVLTGEEAFGSYINPSLQRYGVYLQAADMRVNMGLLGYSTHFQPITMPSPDVDGVVFGFSNDFLYFTFALDTATSLNLTTLDNIKGWFQQQYAAGTPVCVWYVLAEPTTGITNEPLCKIGDYADELHSEDAGVTLSLQTGTSNTISIESALQPSKMNISYYSEGYTDVKKIPMSNPITVTKTSFPAVIKNNLTSSVDSYVIKGGGAQSGTPTPENPIQPEFCGVRTAQLFNKDARDTDNGYVFGSYLKNDGSEYASSTYRISEYIPVTAGISYTLVYGNSLNAPSLCFYDASKDFLQGMKYNNRTIVTETAPNGAAYMRISYGGTLSDSVMLNLGSTAKPYEPFGWAEKITSASQTVPVYLGQTQTVRRIKKLVLTGDEAWVQTQTDRFRTGLTDKFSGIAPVCTHYIGSTSETWNGLQDGEVSVSITTNLAINDQRFENADDFKSYLAQQYAAGTPVCVWYVLVEPQTGIINEPLAKIGTYADELHSTATGAPTIDILSTTDSNSISFDSTIQPSSMSLTYKAEVDKVLSSDGTAVYLSSRQ